jgi:hypothetical protein
MSNQTPKKRGCFFYGCITVLVLFVLATVTLVLGTRYAIHTMIDGVTEDKPVAITRAELPAPRMEEIQKRVDAFKAALDNPTNSFELVLTAEEFNALVASSPDMAAVKDRVYIRIEDDRVKADLSLPCDDLAHFPFGRLRGRYLNGSAVLNVGLKDGQLNVRIESVKLKGKPVEGQFMTHLQGANLAQDISREPKNAAAIGKFESIQIKDGKIIIKVRPPPKEDGEKKSDKKGVEAI